jgi:hypothetical protein
MPGIVKIGSTRLSPEARAHQLSTTGVPAPFQVVAYFRFEDELRAERELQALFSGQRVHPRREFYEATVEEAREALLRLSGGNLSEQASAPHAVRSEAPPSSEAEAGLKYERVRYGVSLLVSLQ